MGSNPTFQVDALREWTEQTPSTQSGYTPPPPPPAHITDTALVLLDVATDIDDEEGWGDVRATMHGPEGACAASQFLLDARLKPLPLLTAIDGDSDLVQDNVEITVCPDCLPVSAGLAHAVPIAAALEVAGQWRMDIGEFLSRPVQECGQHCCELLKCRLELDFPTATLTGTALPQAHPDHPGNGTDFGALTDWWQHLRTWWAAELHRQMDALRTQQTGWDGPLMVVTSKEAHGLPLGAFYEGTSITRTAQSLLAVLTVAPVVGTVAWGNDIAHAVLTVPAGTDLTDGGVKDTWVRLGDLQPGAVLDTVLAALPTLFDPPPADQQHVDELITAFTTALDPTDTASAPNADYP